MGRAAQHPGRSRLSARRAAVFALALALAPSLHAPALAQSIEVDPAQGPPGTSVSVEGFGFQPGESVELRFAGQTLGSGVADDEGFVGVSGTIPEGVPAGSHPMDLVGSGGTQASTDFEVVAEVQESPAPDETAQEDPGGEGEQEEPTEATGGEGGARQRSGGDGAREASAQDGSLSLIDVLLGVLLVLLLTALLLPSASGPTILPLITVAIIELLRRWWNRSRGDEGPTEVGPCHSYDRVRVDAGQRVVVTGTERKQGLLGGCTWHLKLEVRASYFNHLYKCTLMHGHREPHAYEANPSVRDPSTPGQTYELVTRRWEEQHEDPNCDKGEELVCDEALKKYAHVNRVAVTTGGGSGNLLEAPCRVCGEPRGNKRPCPHCGMD